MSSRGVEVAVEGVHKAFGPRRVLGGVDLRVRSGELVAIVGRSGCGKSTLLRVLAGLERADAGEVLVDGTSFRGSHPDVRMIFQDARLLPWSRTLANVALGARAEQRGRAFAAERGARAEELLAQVGLADRANEWPGKLSGGQRQRIALARGLMSAPRLLLLDEPLGALDALTRLEMQLLVERLWSENGFTAVLVTHDIDEAVALADRVVLLDAGTVTADVALAMARPRVRESRDFVEASALLRRRLMRAEAPAQVEAAPPSPETTEADRRIDPVVTGALRASLEGSSR